MSFFPNLIKELRDRKLWPIAIGLIVALVAVPVLLSKKTSTDLVTPQPTGGLPYSTGTTLPAISVQTTSASSKLPGNGRNPFTPQHIATTATTTTAATITPVTTSSGSGSSGTGSTGSTGSTGGSSGGGSGVSSTPAPSSSTPAPAPSKPAPKPGPPSLTATQSYQVSLAISGKASGNLNTIDPLERLSILPSPQEPLLVEYGVLQGGHQVVFAVQPGAAVSGPGTCTPGPIDCEVLTLSPGQTEAVSKQTPTGSTPVADFQVNSITAAQHPSAAAADQARRNASEVGRKLLVESSYTALSLFQYDPSVGAIVDLRNLTVGGN
jgi:hypothetical protein